jgi:hypothetical protein
MHYMHSLSGVYQEKMKAGYYAHYCSQCPERRYKCENITLCNYAKENRPPGISTV